MITISTLATTEEPTGEPTKPNRQRTYPPTEEPTGEPTGEPTKPNRQRTYPRYRLIVHTKPKRTRYPPTEEPPCVLFRLSRAKASKASHTKCCCGCRGIGETIMMKHGCTRCSPEFKKYVLTACYATYTCGQCLYPESDEY